MEWQSGQLHEDVPLEKDSYLGKLGYVLAWKEEEAFLEKETSRVVQKNLEGAVSLGIWFPEAGLLCEIERPVQIASFQ